MALRSTPRRWSRSRPIPPAERAYLDALAHKLKLDPGLVAEIHKTAGAHAPSQGTGKSCRLRADEQRLSYTAVLSCGSNAVSYLGVSYI